MASSSSSENSSLFKCYGVGLVRSSPENLYPQTRCFGLRGPTTIDYSKYYSNSHFCNEVKQKPKLLSNTRRGRNWDSPIPDSDQDETQPYDEGHKKTNGFIRKSPSNNNFQSIEISPKSIAKTIGPALAPSLSPNIPLPPEPTPKSPQFPKPIHHVNWREDFCLGVMTVGLDSFSQCNGLSIGVLFEESSELSDQDEHHQDQLVPIHDDIATERRFPKYNQEMVPAVMEPLDELEYENDEDDDQDEELNESSIQSSQRFSRERFSERLRDKMINIPKGLWKVGERTILLSKTSLSSMYTPMLKLVTDPKTFLLNTYRRVFELEERSLKICRRTWIGLEKLFGTPPTPPP